MSKTISQRLFRHTATAAFVAAFLLGAIWIYMEYQDVRENIDALNARHAIEQPQTVAPTAPGSTALAPTAPAAKTPAAKDPVQERKALEKRLSDQGMYVTGYVFLAVMLTLLLVRGFPRKLEQELGRAQNMVRRAVEDAQPADVRDLEFPELAELVQPVNEMSGEVRGLREDLECAQRDVQESRKVKDEFLANVSHELRTPLNGAMGLLQLLQLSELTDEQKDMVDQAMTCNQSLVAVLNDILDVSSVGNGELVIEAQPFSLNGILSLVRATFGKPAETKGLEFHINTDPSVPNGLVGDSVRLRQILFHLVSNAVKFTEQGTVNVDITRLEGFGDTDRVRLLLVVSDTGIGIPDDKVAEAFDVFTQVEGAMDKAYTGIGIGLGLVRMLVSLMGGILDISTEKGVGTEVYLRLDFGLAKGDVPMPERHDKTAAPGTLAILLAEDNTVNQLFVKRMLSRIGHRVVAATTGKEVLAALEKEIFDCILMDIQMPVMDGMEATRRIRAGESAADPDIPIIALTAHVLPGDQERFMEAGMSAFVAKPLEFSTLLAAMGRVL